MRQLFFILILSISSFADTAAIPTRFYSIATKAIPDVVTPTTTVLAPQYRGINLYTFPFTDSTITENEKISNTVPSGFGIDLLAKPLLWMSFGNFEDPTKIATGVSARIRIHGWKGFQFDSQSYFTFYNEIYRRK